MQDHSCIQSAATDQQNPPEHVISELNKAIDKIDRDKRRDDECDPQPEASTFGDEAPEFDSGGGGNTNPPQPGGPTRPK